MGGRSLRERLLGMGICVGDVIRVIQRQGRGAVIISKDGGRYGLGSGMAYKIFVEKE
jgi:Fe2+ transport system protein FeoA